VQDSEFVCSESEGEGEGEAYSQATSAPKACKEGDAQFEAISVICNLSANDEAVRTIRRYMS